MATRRTAEAKPASRMSAKVASIDAYLAPLPADQKAALEELRRTIRSIVPDAEETISYGMPAFKVEGKGVAYFLAAKNHLSYFPGARFDELGPKLEKILERYDTSKGTIRFQPDKPLPKALVKKLVLARLARVGVRRGKSPQR